MATYGTDIEGRTMVYRAYIGDDLAYVGVTRNPAGRFSKHASLKPWWQDVDTILTTWYETRELAFKAEREYIAEEDPIYNASRPAVR